MSRPQKPEPVAIPAPHACKVHHDHTCINCGNRTACCCAACQSITWGRCNDGCSDPLAKKPFGVVVH